MAVRPITGWTSRPNQPPSWGALDGALERTRESFPPLDAAVETAAARWGRSRVAEVQAREHWGGPSSPRSVGLAYSVLGPGGGDILETAWGLLEFDIADAVSCWVESAEWVGGFLLERAGRASLQLGRYEPDGAELTLLAEPHEGARAVVTASVAVDCGIPCGAAFEPDCVRVRRGEAVWSVEVRP